MKIWYLPFFLLFTGLTIGLGYHTGQSNFPAIWGMSSTFFMGYLLAFYFAKDQDVLFFVGLGIFLRLLLVFTLPNWSDDIYRFIWDGRLIINGMNPFDHLPSYYIEQGVKVPGLTLALYQELNSPDYFTIYPPVAQVTFAISCLIFPNSVLGSAILMKGFLLAFEIGSLILLIKILRHFQLPSKNVLLYALNPLIIMEITGNLHFEGGMIFFLLLAYWFLLKNRWAPSAIAMALSIASKLLPLIFLPFLIRRLGWGRSIRYFLLVGAVLALLFIPLFSGVFIENFGNSLDLYFRKFEFNASAYYLFRWRGYQVYGYNTIATLGPRLAMATLTGILLLAFFERKPDWQNWAGKMLFAICLYLLFTTTVHPWYTSLPVVLCLFTRFRFPILWSGLILLTYINYSYDPYFEDLRMVGVEYGLVGMVFFGEFFWKKKQIKI